MIGSCCCKTCSSTVSCTVTINGCSALALSGAAYTIYDPDGIVITTGTTGGSGQVTFTANKLGTYTADASKANFNSVTGATLFTLTRPCPMTASATVTLTAATGYLCIGGCADPIQLGNLTVTDSVFGTATLTWNGGTTITTAAWSGTISITYGGCGSPCFCFPVAGSYILTYNFGFSGGPSITVSGLAVTGPPDCPNNSVLATDEIWGSFVLTITSCPPTFSADTSFTSTGNCLYCGVAGTITVS